MRRMISMLDQDVVSVSDGGGKARAVLEPIASRESVADFLLGPLRNVAAFRGETNVEPRMINGQLGFVLRSEEGIHTAGLLHVENDRVRRLYFVRNPDKLKHVGS